MNRFVVNLGKVSLKEFLSKNEIEKGDIIELSNLSYMYFFTLEREFFELEDPDTVAIDDIVETLDELHTIYPKAYFKYEGDKYFDEVEYTEDSQPTIYGKLSLVDDYGKETQIKNLTFIPVNFN